MVILKKCQLVAGLYIIINIFVVCNARDSPLSLVFPAPKFHGTTFTALPYVPPRARAYKVFKSLSLGTENLLPARTCRPVRTRDNEASCALSFSRDEATDSLIRGCTGNKKNIQFSAVQWPLYIHTRC